MPSAHNSGSRYGLPRNGLAGPATFPRLTLANNIPTMALVTCHLRLTNNYNIHLPPTRLNTHFLRVPGSIAPHHSSDRQALCLLPAGLKERHQHSIIHQARSLLSRHRHHLDSVPQKRRHLGKGPDLVNILTPTSETSRLKHLIRPKVSIRFHPTVLQHQPFLASLPHFLVADVHLACLFVRVLSFLSSDFLISALDVLHPFRCLMCLKVFCVQ